MKIVVQGEQPEQEILELFCLLKAPMDTLVFTSDSVTDTSPVTDGAVIEITKSDKCTLRADAVNIDIQVEQALYMQTLNKVISGLLGYRQAVLSGLCVRDSNGNRIKPQIQIYIKNDMRLEIPNSFEFTKEIPSASGTTIRLAAFTYSPIIQSLLENTPLHFRSGPDTLSLEMTNSQIYAISHRNEISPIRDFMTDHTIQSAIDKAVDSENTHFTKQLRLILSKNGSENEIKAFFRKISKGLTDAEYAYLSDVVRNLPRFHDSRDELRANLENYLVLSAPFSPAVKHEYLEVRKCKMPEMAGDLSLRRYSKQ